MTRRSVRAMSSGASIVATHSDVALVNFCPGKKCRALTSQLSRMSTSAVLANCATNTLTAIEPSDCPIVCAFSNTTTFSSTSFRTLFTITCTSTISA